MNTFLQVLLLIDQRLASTDQTQQVVTSTANPTTISPNVTIKTVNNSFAWEGSERNASIDLKHRLGGGSRRGRLSGENESHLWNLF